jgi:hypothetical protein
MGLLIHTACGNECSQISPGYFFKTILTLLLHQHKEGGNGVQHILNAIESEIPAVLIPQIALHMVFPGNLYLPEFQ